MKIVARQAQVTFDEKDEEALGKVWDILDDTADAMDSGDSLITKDGLVYSDGDVEKAMDLIYSLTFNNPTIGDPDEEGADD